MAEEKILDSEKLEDEELENVAGGTQAVRALKLTLNTDKQVNVVTLEDLEEFLKNFGADPLKNWGS